VPIVNVQVAVHRDGAWLIIERSRHEEHAPGELALPGGKVEVAGAADAVLEQTARREILEETGLHLGPVLTYVHSSSFMTDRGDDVVNVVFLAEEATGSASARSELEVEQVLWMSHGEVRDHPDAPAHLRDSLSRAEAMRRG
jgi:8-oxo-dGTP diphosphatase